MASACCFAPVTAMSRTARKMGRASWYKAKQDDLEERMHSEEMEAGKGEEQREGMPWFFLFQLNS